MTRLYQDASKPKMRSLLLILLSLSLLGGVIFTAVGYTYEKQDRDLEQHRITTTGRITKIYQEAGMRGYVYYGVDFTYRDTGSSTEYTRSREVTPESWNTLMVGQKLPIVYNSTHPSDGYIVGSEGSSAQDRKTMYGGLITTVVSLVGLSIILHSRKTISS